MGAFRRCRFARPPSTTFVPSGNNPLQAPARSEKPCVHCMDLRSSAVSHPLSQPGTGNNLNDLKEPKQAGWTFGFRA